jgi:hypothetical protein
MTSQASFHPWSTTDAGMNTAKVVISKVQSSFATHKVTPVATLDKPISRSDSGLAISPDHRWLLFSQVDQSGSDIMLVENFR